jgi:hypothetical protein
MGFAGLWTWRELSACSTPTMMSVPTFKAPVLLAVSRMPWRGCDTQAIAASQNEVEME